ncbi:RBBP9/YdeN family alpha/beta hydrolase [Rhodococcus sp. IEGM 1408]|uniref:RBBP9/YdeN family alpha/beta hydrolase n=1 Tax=Rhodococcus sp. IEGM 1408 TaxID=3082220 RepID=UPI00295398A3|nr:alpha/beta hydrolase [Rhodococcus sp. IEGM 1408]MDV8000050.1 alpha/beta hydrolase [Rhodococcus sp. IEGM 1408]
MWTPAWGCSSTKGSTVIATTTARRATIIHGYDAAPEDHWFGWLAGQLESQGIPTTVPALPDSGAPDPEGWLATIGAAVGTPDRDSIVVAHSLGCLTVLRHLHSLAGPWRLGTLVLVAGFVDPLPELPQLDAYIGDGVDVEGCGAHLDRVVVLRSDNDPFVPAGHTDRLARALGASAQCVPGAGHFMASDGFTSLPPVLVACST